MYKNIRYNTGCNRAKMLNNVLNVQKTLLTEPRASGFREFTGKKPVIRRLL